MVFEEIAPGLTFGLDRFEASNARKIALFAAGIGLGAAASLLYDGPFEAGLGPAVAFLVITLTELYQRRA